jgi:hypothetical protein
MNPVKKSLTSFLSSGAGLRIVCTVEYCACCDRPPIRQYLAPLDAVLRGGSLVHPSETSSAISCSRHLSAPMETVPRRRVCSECPFARCGTKSANTRLMASRFRRRTEPDKTRIEPDGCSLPVSASSSLNGGRRTPSAECQSQTLHRFTRSPRRPGPARSAASPYFNRGWN